MLGKFQFKGETAKDLKETLFSLIFCTFGDLITGITMGFFSHKLNALPALMVLIPPAIGMRGNIFASLGSRLGTYFYTGEIVIGKKNKILGENIMATFAQTFTMSFYIGIIAWIISQHFGMKNVSITDLALISLLAGVFSAFLLLFFTFAIAFSSYKRGWNPDNLTAPLITLAGDITTLPLLFFSMEIVVVVGKEIKVAMLAFFLLLSIFSLLLSSRKVNAKRIVIESIPVLLICGLLSSFSGSILGMKAEEILSVAAILTIIPAFLEDGGAIGGILAARFSTYLHTGEIRYGEKLPKKAISLFILMHLEGLIIFPLIGIFGFIAGSYMGLPTYSILRMILISLIAGEIMVLIVNFLSFYVVMVSYKVGMDPDNVTIPILTSLMDFIGTACLIGVTFFLYPA
ncbi:MAG: hypothetical protein DRN11_02550 [Thermoplasmata archaeon]|nr:MAG: hypothetical protein DRN11_02550 [Thermoplasmata archaeon]